MGTTLTGTTPQDTYDSLIKVTDNGPLSGSLKTLTDGLGNDSALALSTSAASVTGTLAVSGTSTFNGGQNVLYASFANDAALFQRVGDYGSVVRLGRSGVSNSTTIDYPADGTFAVSTVSTERMRITSVGNVGIGTASPTAYSGYTTLAINSATSGGVLDFMVGGVRRGSIYNSDSGNALNIDSPTGTTINLLVNGGVRASVTQNGLTFNGDTAAANALDDYEEGTWTPVYASGITGATYANTAGKYTKIGNVVHWSCRIQATAGTAAATALTIGGFPFTNSATQETAGSIGFFSVYTSQSVYMYNEPSTTNIAVFYQIDASPLLGTELTSVTGTIHCSGTYFV